MGEQDVKEKKKYQWEIGKTLPLLDEHSQTKHQLVSDYLKRYVEVVMSNAGIPKISLSIVDGFAGGGRYLNVLDQEPVDGSPFLILKAIKEAEIKLNVNRKVPRSIDAEYHFIEYEKSHIEFLKYELENSLWKDHLQKKIRLYNQTFEASVNGIITHIKRRNPRTQRAIFILDQYSYKDVPFSTVRQIFQTLSNSEVILTFNYDAAQAFISDTANNRRAFEKIQLSQYISWDRLAHFKEQNQWQAAIQEQLSAAIYKASGAKHITLFFIHPKKGQSYWLVHLSKVYKARDVMMDLHWKHSNYDPFNQHFSHYLHTGIFALGYKAVETPGQKNLDIFSPNILDKKTEMKCVENLSTELPKLLCDHGGAITFSELVDSIGSYTVASEKHLKMALQTAITSSEISVITKKGGLRKSSDQLASSDRIEYRQFPIIFLP